MTVTRSWKVYLPSAEAASTRAVPVWWAVNLATGGPLAAGGASRMSTLGLLVLNCTPDHSEDGQADRSTVKSPLTATAVSLPSSSTVAVTCVSWPAGVRGTAERSAAGSATSSTNANTIMIAA